MGVRYYLDPDTGLPHIYGHGVTETEVEQVLRAPGEDYVAARGSRMKIGQTSVGRYLQVIYSPDQGGKSVFVITADTSSMTRRRSFVAGRRGGEEDDRARVPTRLE